MSDIGNYLAKEPKTELAKKLSWAIWALTVVVLGLVVMMRSQNKLDLGIDFSFLPPVHAALNTLVAICLILALVAVKRRNIRLHKNLINTAMGLSVVFLLCYVAYHFTQHETLFGDYNKDGEVSDEEKAQAGSIRSAYIIILASHIILAAVSLPLILFTWLFAVTNQFQKHRKFAVMTYPMWLYVAITGPVCYFMLKPFY